jgi:hypothetical protein
MGSNQRPRAMLNSVMLNSVSKQTVVRYSFDAVTMFGFSRFTASKMVRSRRHTHYCGVMVRRHVDIGFVGPDMLDGLLSRQHNDIGRRNRDERKIHASDPLHSSFLPFCNPDGLYAEVNDRIIGYGLPVR